MIWRTCRPLQPERDGANCPLGAADYRDPAFDFEQYVQTYAHGYSIGVGVQSRIFSENNAWETSSDIPPAALVKFWKGNAVSAIGPCSPLMARCGDLNAMQVTGTR